MCGSLQFYLKLKASSPDPLLIKWLISEPNQPGALSLHLAKNNSQFGQAALGMDSWYLAA
jgi:hypothetical protein